MVGRVAAAQHVFTVFIQLVQDALQANGLVLFSQELRNRLTS